jgi:hypothetical protein
MIHTVHLDDAYSNIKGLLQEIRSQKQGVRFEYHLVSEDTKQEEYMTSEEFRKRAIVKVDKFCKDYGIL